MKEDIIIEWILKEVPTLRRYWQLVSVRRSVFNANSKSLIAKLRNLASGGDNGNLYMKVMVVPLVKTDKKTYLPYSTIHLDTKDDIEGYKIYYFPRELTMIVDSNDKKELCKALEIMINKVSILNMNDNVDARQKLSMLEKSNNLNTMSKTSRSNV